jgi:hypothetical protein
VLSHVLTGRELRASITLATSYLTHATTTTESQTWFRPATTGLWTEDVTRKVHEVALTRVVAQESVIHAPWEPCFKQNCIAQLVLVSHIHGCAVIRHR